MQTDVTDNAITDCDSNTKTSGNIGDTNTNSTVNKNKSATNMDDNTCDTNCAMKTEETWRLAH